MRIPMIIVLVDLVFRATGHSAPSLPPSDVYWFGPEREKLVASIGCSNVSWPSVQRDEAGTRLFLSFKELGGGYKVATISSNEIQLRALPGGAYLGEDGGPVCWYDKSIQTWSFSKRLVLATNLYVTACNSRFVAIADKTGTRQWIASVDAPLKEILSIPATVSVDLLSSFKDSLQFVGTSESGESKGKERQIMKVYEYNLQNSGAKLTRTTQLEWVGRVYDLNKARGLLLIRAEQTYFADASIIDLSTGQRKRVAAKGNDGLFLTQGVIQHLQRLARKHDGQPSPRHQR